MEKSPWNVIPTNKPTCRSTAWSPASSRRIRQALKEMVFFDWAKVNKNRAAWTQQFNRDIRV